MKALITGATGFVGACLARHFVEAGHEVHVFIRAASNTWRISDMLNRLTAHEVDLRNSAAVEYAIAAIRPRIICHLATYGGFTAQIDSKAIYESNFIGTMNLVRACAKTGFDCFVNTGSSSEYGMKTAPMEETDVLDPLGAYGVSKAASTLFCRSEAIEKQLPIITLRLFSPYGPWDDPKRLVPSVITSLLHGEQPQLSTPQSVRDYIFITDVLAAYDAVIKNPLSGEIFNIGSGGQHAIGAVVALLQDIIGSEVAPLWGAQPRQRPEPEQWLANIKKAETKLGWRPATPLRQGLECTVAWMKANPDFYRTESRKKI